MRKGQKCTEEANLRNSEIVKRLWQDPEYRARVIKARANSEAYANRGPKISKANKGRLISKETREKISLGMTGKVRSEIHQKRLSDSNKKRWKRWKADSEFMEKYGRRISERMKGTKQTEESNAKRSRTMKGRIPVISKEARKRQAEAIRGRPKSEETKQKLQTSQRRLWADPEYKNAQIEAILMGVNKRPNKFEELLHNFIEMVLCIPTEYVGDGQLVIGGKCPDFIIEGTNLLVEGFGDYWHKGENPQDRINHFNKEGYECLVIWEHEMKKVEFVTNKLLTYYNKRR